MEKEPNRRRVDAEFQSAAASPYDRRLDQLIDRLPRRFRSTVRWLRQLLALDKNAGGRASRLRRSFRLPPGLGILDAAAWTDIARRRFSAAQIDGIPDSGLDRTPLSAMAGSFRGIQPPVMRGVPGVYSSTRKQCPPSEVDLT